MLIQIICYISSTQIMHGIHIKTSQSEFCMFSFFHLDLEKNKTARQHKLFKSSIKYTLDVTSFEFKLAYCLFELVLNEGNYMLITILP